LSFLAVAACFAGMATISGCVFPQNEQAGPADPLAELIAALTEFKLWPDGQEDRPPPIPGLEKFASPDEFKQYLLEQSHAVPGWYFEEQGVGRGAPAADDGADGGSDPDFSTTNIQEAGVDEGDVFKNDATYLYVLAGEELRIVRAVPVEEMEVVSRLELPVDASEMYLRGDQLIALSGTYYPVPAGVVVVIDVTDRERPSIEGTLEIQGQLVTSRLINARLHLVLRVWPVFPSISEPPDAIAEAELEAWGPDELIPDMAVTLADGVTAEYNIADWDDMFRPTDPDGSDLTVVATVNLDDLSQPPQQAGIVTEAMTVYASRYAVYVTDSDYNCSGERRETTLISRIDLRDEGPVLVAAGRVPGRPLNRYSLGEYDGYLRVATTTGHVSRVGDGDAKNHVYVLAPEAGELIVAGKIEDIAAGEKIYSARFLGKRGFLVTFKKVDPLFTLDLSDPTAPRVVGELKVPGYSDYIHPLGPDHLLTIGKDAVDMGDFAWYQGVQLSLFDVTDFANPQRVDAEIVGERGTESEALHDPHAFNYFDPVEVLAMPIRICENAGPQPSSFGKPTFDGVCLFRVTTEDGIEPVGRIPMREVDSGHGWGWYGWSTRGVFIGDCVYAVTSSLVRAVPLDDPNAEPFELPLE